MEKEYFNEYEVFFCSNDKVLKLESIYNIMNAINATDLYILERLIMGYLNSTSIKRRTKLIHGFLRRDCHQLLLKMKLTFYILPLNIFNVKDTGSVVGEQST